MRLHYITYIALLVDWKIINRLHHLVPFKVTDETERYINATLDRDFKKGERISFPFKHMYPYVLAAVEKAYHIAEHDGKVKEVPREVFEQTLKNLGDINKEFIETLYKKEITSK